MKHSQNKYRCDDDKNAPLKTCRRHVATTANPLELDCKRKILHLSERTHIMGILNVTPDSFSDGGQFYEPDHAVERALIMAEEGADIIDIGGESTRPGAGSVDEHEEMRRVIPVIERLQQEISIPLSIDTQKSTVAEAAIQAGVNVINDISALRGDPCMVTIVKKYRVPVVLMHMKGTPRNMQKNPVYHDLIGEIYDYLNQSISMATEAGISRSHVVVDPGIGFGKTWPDNFIILQRLQEFLRLRCPLLVGVSRKSFIGWALDLPEGDRLMGTAAAVTASILHGAHMVRVHDVKEMVQVVCIADQIKKSRMDGKDRSNHEY